MISPAELDRLMHVAWPGQANIPVDGWIARLAGGVTQRANSVLPIDCPSDVAAALEQVEALYREQGPAPTFQLSPAARPASLDAMLAERGYERRSPTVVQVAAVDAVLQRLAAPEIPVSVNGEPDQDWMDLWWSVDGRGGLQAKEIARRIITSCRALYALSSDDAGAAAVGRLALVGDWGGIYCMAVREDARRHGQARAILRMLLEKAAERGIRNVWLQVVEDNHGARAFYEKAGFVAASRYHYRVCETKPFSAPPHAASMVT